MDVLDDAGNSTRFAVLESDSSDSPHLLGLSQNLSNVGSGYSGDKSRPHERGLPGGRERGSGRRELQRLRRREVVELPHVLLEVEVPAEPLAANGAGEGLLVVVRVHVECEVVDLVEGLVADAALVRLLPAVGQLVVLVVALLVEPLPAELARERLVTCVQKRIERSVRRRRTRRWRRGERGTRRRKGDGGGDEDQDGYE